MEIKFSQILDELENLDTLDGLDEIIHHSIRSELKLDHEENSSLESNPSFLNSIYDLTNQFVQKYMFKLQEIQTLRDNIESISRDYTVLKEENDDLQGIIDNFSEQMNKLSSYLQESDNVHNSLQREISNLRAENSGLQSTLTQQTTQITTLLDEIQANQGSSIDEQKRYHFHENEELKELLKKQEAMLAQMSQELALHKPKRDEIYQSTTKIRTPKNYQGNPLHRQTKSNINKTDLVLSILPSPRNIFALNSVRSIKNNNNRYQNIGDSSSIDLFSRKKIIFPSSPNLRINLANNVPKIDLTIQSPSDQINKNLLLNRDSSRPLTARTPRTPSVNLQDILASNTHPNRLSEQDPLEQGISHPYANFEFETHVNVATQTDLESPLKFKRKPRNFRREKIYEEDIDPLFERPLDAGSPRILLETLHEDSFDFPSTEFYANVGEPNYKKASVHIDKNLNQIKKNSEVPKTIIAISFPFAVAIFAWQKFKSTTKGILRAITPKFW